MYELYLEVEQTDDGHVCRYILLSCALYIMGTVVWTDQEILFKHQFPLLKYSPLVFIATGCEQPREKQLYSPRNFPAAYVPLQTCCSARPYTWAHS